MASTLAALLTPVSETEAEETVLALLEAVGFPATSWQRFSVPRTLVRLSAQLYADARTGIASIVKSRLLDLADGDALDYLASNFFETEREPAVATEGEFLLEDTGGAPYDIVAGQLLTQDRATGLRFVNTTGGTLAADGALTIGVRAEETGADYNIGNDADLEFVETLEGVSVSNPAIAGSDTWITTSGADEQTDESLRETCRAKWATVGAGTADAYEAWAREGAPTVTKVKVLDNANSVTGVIRVLLANDNGGASAAEVSAADAVIQAKRPIGLLSVTTDAAFQIDVTLDATVNLYSGATTYLANLNAAVDAFNAELQIGQEVYLTRLDALLHAPGNVRNVAITSPVGTTPVDEESVAKVIVGTITVNTVA